MAPMTFGNPFILKYLALTDFSFSVGHVIICGAKLLRNIATLLIILCNELIVMSNVSATSWKPDVWWPRNHKKMRTWNK